jgi:hypothetical protein
MPFLGQPGGALAKLIWWRAADAPKVHVTTCEMVGSVEAPALRLIVWVEETSGRGGHACDFKVALTEPMKAQSTRVEAREGAREAVVVAMPLSFPPRGASPELRLIAHLDASLPTRAGTIRGRVAAIGPTGYKVKWTGFSGSYNWEG